MIRFLLAILLLCCALSGQLLVVTDMDADPFGLGGAPGALFLVNVQTVGVTPLWSDPDWQDPMHVVQGGGPVWWVLDFTGGTVQQLVWGPLGPISTTTVYDAGLTNPVRWFTTSASIPYIVDGSGTIHQASSPPSLEVLVSGPPLLGPVAMAEDAAGTLYVLDADARPIAYPPVGPWISEGALFAVGPTDNLIPTIASCETISPMDLEIVDSTVYLLDGNAGILVTGIPSGVLFRADLQESWPITDLEVVTDTGMCDPVDLVPETPTTMLFVDMSADPGGFGQGFGAGYHGTGRGAIGRVDLVTGQVTWIAWSPLFVSPVRAEYLL